jgi:hypothetical protein
MIASHLASNLRAKTTTLMLGHMPLSVLHGSIRCIHSLWRSMPRPRHNCEAQLVPAVPSDCVDLAACHRYHHVGNHARLTYCKLGFDDIGRLCYSIQRSAECTCARNTSSQQFPPPIQPALLSERELCFCCAICPTPVLAKLPPNRASHLLTSSPCNIPALRLCGAAVSCTCQTGRQQLLSPPPQHLETENSCLSC